MSTIVTYCSNLCMLLVCVCVCDLSIVTYLLFIKCVLLIVPYVKLICIVRMCSVYIVQCLPSEALFSLLAVLLLNHCCLHGANVRIALELILHICYLYHPFTMQIKCSQMCEWLEKYHTCTEQHCTRLQDEIESRLFPPCIQLRLTYAKDPTAWTSRQSVSLVVKRIMAPTDHIQFPLQVKVPGNGKRWKYTAMKFRHEHCRN